MIEFLTKKRIFQQINRNVMMQFFKFGIVGITNNVIYLLIYYAFVFAGFNYIVGNTVGFLVSVINAYYWNSKLVFKKSMEKTLASVLKTYLSYGITFLLSTVLLMILVDVINISKVIAPIATLVVTVPLNFTLNKYWVFK